MFKADLRNAVSVERQTLGEWKIYPDAQNNKMRCSLVHRQRENRKWKYQICSIQSAFNFNITWADLGEHNQKLSVESQKSRVETKIRRA